MKIVINKCYGGFGVSALALKRLIELGAKGIESWPQEEDGLGYGDPVDLGNGFVGYPLYDVVIKDGAIYSFNRDYEHRNDPLLVQVIEELGVNANGRFAELKIVDIPDNLEYEIEEYDGVEWVAEKHRTWG